MVTDDNRLVQALTEKVVVCKMFYCYISNDNSD